MFRILGDLKLFSNSNVHYIIFGNVSLGFRTPKTLRPNRIYCTGPWNDKDGRRGRDDSNIINDMNYWHLPLLQKVTHLFFHRYFWQRTTFPPKTTTTSLIYCWILYEMRSLLVLRDHTEKYHLEMLQECWIWQATQPSRIMETK